MKKLIIISLALLILMGLGLYESIVSYKVYTEIMNDCKSMEVVLNEEDEVSENALSKFVKIEKQWNKHKAFSLIFSNHNQVKDFTQKLNTLKGYLEEKDKKESIVALLSLKATTEFLIRENVPLMENIL